jgi:cytochrome c oxidase subunit 4
MTDSPPKELDETGARGSSGRALGLTLVALLALACLSLGLRYAPLGALGLPAAILIALTKAALVAVFFMEILREKASVRLALTTGVTLLLLMLALIAADVSTRAPATPPAAGASRGAD